MSRRSDTADARALDRDFLFQAGSDTFIGRLDPGLDLADLDQDSAEPALQRLADLAGGQCKGRVRDRAVEAGFCHHAEVDVGRAEPALLGEIVERQSGRDAASCRLRFFSVRKYDLRHLALFRLSQLVAALLEHLPGILVGDRGPLADLLRVEQDKGYLAVFGRAELGFVIVEIAGQRFRRWRIDRSGLRGVEFDVFEAALFVLEAAERFDLRFRRLKTGRNRAGDLTPQRHPPLFGDVTLFAVAELPDRGLETLRIERAGYSLEIGIAEDRAHGLGVGLSKPHPPRFFVEGRLGNGLLQHLPVEAEGAGLIHRQRTAELAADLLQLLGIGLAELLGRNLGPADRGERRLSVPPEDVGDTPETETDDQHTHHHGHDGLAEPV